MTDVSIMDAQARIIQRLTGDLFDLALIVFSGSKSLQAWFPIKGADEETVLTFIARAMKLGADKAAKTAHQFFRMPHGWNHKRNCRQPAVYFNPAVLNNK
jgi:hypothetical protein